MHSDVFKLTDIGLKFWNIFFSF